jgi:hypothetical protein
MIPRSCPQAIATALYGTVEVHDALLTNKRKPSEEVFVWRERTFSIL